VTRFPHHPRKKMLRREPGQREYSTIAHKLKQRANKYNPPRIIDLRYFVSDGRTSCGFVELRGDRFLAVDSDGTKLGKFSTLSAAVGALPRRSP
jgi:hypothetical protein